MKFAKLFELENDEQVLVTYQFNNDEDQPQLTIRTDFDEMVGQITLGFDRNDEDKALAALNNYTLKNAIDFRANLAKSLTED